MNRRAFVSGLGTVLTASLAAEAQQTEKVWRIDVLRTQSRETHDSAADGFRQGLRELGYVDGENVILKYRWAEGRPDQLPTLAQKLVRTGVDVIVTGGEQAIRALVRATSTVPIVMGASNDPVRAGFAASLARPAETSPV